MKIDESNIFYVKKNSRYIPCGVSYPKDMLSEGLWYVRVTPGCRSITNVSYLGEIMKLNDTPIVGNATELCELEDIASKVMGDDDFKKRLLDFNSKGYSINDVVHTTIAVIKKLANEKKTNN